MFGIYRLIKLNIYIYVLMYVKFVKIDCNILNK